MHQYLGRQFRKLQCELYRPQRRVGFQHHGNEWRKAGYGMPLSDGELMSRALASTTASLVAALLLVLALGGTAMAQSATVMTDQADYAPGSIVTITGSGWQPGETVTLQLVESPLID